jgi:hypothetical protein
MGTMALYENNFCISKGKFYVKNSFGTADLFIFD